MLWILAALIVCVIAFGWWGIVVFVGLVAVFYVAMTPTNKPLIEGDSSDDQIKITHFSNFTSNQLSEEKKREIDKKANIRETWATLANPNVFKNLYSRRKQIIDESIAIMSNTTNLQTLNIRYADALEHAAWMKEQITNGAPITFREEPCGFEGSLNRFFNEQLVRLASNHFEKYLKTSNTLKTDSAKMCQKEKIKMLLNECLAVIKQNENQEETKDIIMNIIDEYEL